MRRCPYCHRWMLEDEEIEVIAKPAWGSTRGDRIEEKNDEVKAEVDPCTVSLRPRKRSKYHLPPLSLLEPGLLNQKKGDKELSERKRLLEETLSRFGIDGEVKKCHQGPIITTYEFFPSPGTKPSQVAELAENLTFSFETESVRIQRIPGKSSLGIEIPNEMRQIIRLCDIIGSDKFQVSSSKLTFALGRDVYGGVVVADLAAMPHLLIAGSSGTGKSVALNALITSILFKATPEEVKLILVDTKKLEFSLYEGIPHLLCPIINDPKKAHIVLMEIVKKMEERFRLLQSAKVRNIEQYNEQVTEFLATKKGRLNKKEKAKLRSLPYIVLIVDELADLMMFGKQEIEFFIGRLAQLARAVGIHLVMATQRPSFDVITGTIKNNFSCRIAFRVPSKVDSRIIIDTGGAERLLGMGDMLFLPPNVPRPVRVHGAFISIPETRRLAKHAQSQGRPIYDARLLDIASANDDIFSDRETEKDELYEKAIELVLKGGQASASFIQRRLKLGYARAARIIDCMETEGIIGASEGPKPRVVLINYRDYLKRKRRKRPTKSKARRIRK